MEYRLEQTHAIHELPMQTYTHEQVAFVAMLRRFVLCFHVRSVHCRRQTKKKATIQSHN